MYLKYLMILIKLFFFNFHFQAYTSPDKKYLSLVDI